MAGRAQAQALLELDLKATIRCSRMVAPGAAAGGCLLNMGWDHATSGGMAGDDAELHAAVKAAVLGFSKSFARAVAPEVRVNVLCPGWIETAFAEGADRAFHAEVARDDAVAALGPSGRTSPAPRCGWRRRAPSFVTGQAININGGTVG